MATTAVVVLVPALSAWALRRSGLIGSLIPLVAVAVAVSLTLAFGLGRAWERRPRPGGLLFSELLLWGWYGRWHQTRKLADARRVLVEAHEETQPVQKLDVLEEVAVALEAQDRYLAGHSRRVARHASLIARALQLPREDVALVRAAAAVHDVGKLFIPLEVLDKPGALTDEEFAVIRRHPDEGARLVSSLEDPALTSIVRHHHERLDGHGYPDGLTGTDIPLGSRIIAVVDTFDAVTSPRPYRPAASHRQALDILRDAAGTQLDEEAVDAFIRCYAGRRSVLLWSAIASSLQGLVGAPAQASALIGDLAIRAVAVAAAAGAAVTLAGPAAAGPVPAPPRLLASVGGAAVADDPLATAIPTAGIPVELTGPAHRARGRRRGRSRSAAAGRRAARAAQRRRGRAAAPRSGGGHRATRRRAVTGRPAPQRVTAPAGTAAPGVLGAPAPAPAPAQRPTPLAPAQPPLAPAPAAGTPGVSLAPPRPPVPSSATGLQPPPPAWPAPPGSPQDTASGAPVPPPHHGRGHGHGKGHGHGNSNSNSNSNANRNANSNGNANSNSNSNGNGTSNGNGNVNGNGNGDVNDGEGGTGAPHGEGAGGQARGGHGS